MIVLPPKIINADCLEVMTQMETAIFDIVLLDPPYFDYQTHHRKDKQDKLSQALYPQSREDQLRTVQESIRLLKDGCSFWYFSTWQDSWWFQQRFQSFLRNMVIWDKGNWTAGDLEGSLATEYEVIFLGTKGRGWKYRGDRIPSIWRKDEKYDLNRPGTKRIHSTEKPVDLYKKIIEISTEPGDFILDPYGGSGASAIAAIETGRNMLMIEIDQEYYKRILRRIDATKHST